MTPNFPKIKQREQLSQLTHETFQPFTIALGDGLLHCRNVFRLLPKKRLVVRGEWKGKEVVAKLFFSGQVMRHVRRELKGSRLLEKARVMTPKILYSGITMLPGLSVVLYEYIEPESNIESIWMDEARFSELKLLLTQMQSVLVGLHQKGIYHRDLHPHNFILAKKGLYLIDVSELRVSFFKKELGVYKSIRNLAQLYSQLSVMHQPLILKMFKRYCQIRQWTYRPALEKRLLSMLYQLRCLRMNRYLEKSFKTCSNFMSYRSLSFRSIFSRQHFSKELHAFSRSPDDHVQEENILKKGNTCTTFRAILNNKPFVIKRYNIKNWKHLLKICWRSSRAERSWGNAVCLDLLRIPSAKPVAFFEKRWCWLFHGKSYFVYEYIPGKRLDQFFLRSTNEQEKHFVAEKIKVLFDAFQNMHIVHRDMKATNFIVQDGAVFLLDLDAMRFCESSFVLKREHVKDIYRFLENWNEYPNIQRLFVR